MHAFKPLADRFEALQIAAGDQFCNQKVLQNDDLANDFGNEFNQGGNNNEDIFS